MTARCLPSPVDAAKVLASSGLRGCYGIRPVSQTKDHTCGAAAAATVLRWFGFQADEATAAQVMGTNRVTGTTWNAITLYLRKRGLKATPYARFDLRELLRRCDDQLPTLVEWMDWGEHWVVCVGYEPTMGVLVFADPARGRSRFACHRIDDFMEAWRAPAAGDIPGVPQLAITADLWKGGRVRPDHPSARFRSHWSHMLKDWPTRKQWVEVHRALP